MGVEIDFQLANNNYKTGQTAQGKVYMDELDLNGRDHLAMVAKGVVGTLPFLGPLAAEALGGFIPKLWSSRVAEFLRTLNQRVGALSARLDLFEKNITTEEGFAIYEHALIQAMRSVSKERKERLAKLVARALTSEEIKHEECCKILNIYRELTDPEIVWLIYYSLHPTLGRGRHSEWRDRHPEILSPISPSMSSDDDQFEKAALQSSYKNTLARLGLIDHNEKIGGATITTLGEMLVRYITDEDE